MKRSIRDIVRDELYARRRDDWGGRLLRAQALGGAGFLADCVRVMGGWPLVRTVCWWFEGQ